MLNDYKTDELRSRPHGRRGPLRHNLLVRSGTVLLHRPEDQGAADHRRRGGDEGLVRGIERGEKGG